VLICIVARPPTLDVKSSTKNTVALILRQPHCMEHGGDTGYINGYAIFYHPLNHPGMGSLMTFLLKDSIITKHNSAFLGVTVISSAVSMNYCV